MVGRLCAAHSVLLFIQTFLSAPEHTFSGLVASEDTVSSQPGLESEAYSELVLEGKWSVYEGFLRA